MAIKELVICKICSKKMRNLATGHLKVHNISLNQYKEMFPNTKYIANDLIEKSRLRIIKTHKKYGDLAERGYKAAIKKYPDLHKRGYKASISKNPDFAKEGHKANLRKNPDLYKRAQKGQQRFREENPTFFSDLGKKYSKQRSQNMSKTIKNWHKIMKEEHPEEYKKWKKQATSHSDGRYFIEYYKKYPDARKKTIEIVKKRKPNHYKNMGKRLFKHNLKHPENLVKGAHASQKKRIENSPYEWNGGKFPSWEEMEVAKLLLDKPIDGINTQVRVGRIKVDYFPEQKVFIEYHPWDHPTNKRTIEEYKKQRLEAIEKSKYGKTPFVLISDGFRDQKEKVLQQIKQIKKEFGI